MEVMLLLGLVILVVLWVVFSRSTREPNAVEGPGNDDAEWETVTLASMAATVDQEEFPIWELSPIDDDRICSYCKKHPRRLLWDDAKKHTPPLAGCTSEEGCRCHWSAVHKSELRSNSRIAVFRKDGTFDYITYSQLKQSKK